MPALVRDFLPPERRFRAPLLGYRHMEELGPSGPATALAGDAAPPEYLPGI